MLPMLLLVPRAIPVDSLQWRPTSTPRPLVATARAAYPLRDNRSRTHDADGRRAAAMQQVAGTVFDAPYAFNMHIKKLLSAA